MGVLQQKLLPGILPFMMGWQLLAIEVAFATVKPHDGMQLRNYEPPDQGGPDHSQSSGSR